MARALVQEKDWPAEALPVAERIRLLGFGVRYTPDHKLADISKRVQVRDEEALAPTREVGRYTQGMRNGDKFPPAIITADGYLVDGATRTEAARRAGKDTFHAFVLDQKYEGAPETMIQQLKTLGGAFNLTHGRGMSPSNIERVIDAVTEEDDRPRDIARKLHISESTVSTVLNGKKARNRAERLGVELNGTFTASHMKLFGGKSEKYTDPVFAGLVSLAQDAHLSVPASNDLCKRLEAVGTESDRLTILEAERASYHEIIAGAASMPSRAAKLRRSLGFLNGQEDPDRLVELNPEASDDHSRAIREAIEKLQKIQAAQYRLEITRPAR